MLSALATFAAAEGEAPNPLIPAWYDIIWSAVCFVIILVVFWKVALPAMQKLLDERKLIARRCAFELPLGGVIPGWTEGIQLLAPGANLRSPKRGLSPRTVQYVHTILHRAFKDAVRHGLLQSNPADLADPPPSTAGQKAGLKVWTGAELGSFLQQSEADGDRDHPLWRLIAATGMRRGEALGLRWADVDLGA